MSGAEFFHRPEVRRVVERAGRAAGMPASVHFVQDGQEGPCILSIGQCAACKLVSALPTGSSACRASRRTPSVRALRGGRTIPFLCHLGFACVSVPVLPGEGFVLTLGPYCPMEAYQTLEMDLRAGLERLRADSGVKQIPDDDYGALAAGIRLAPASAIPEIAEWAAETLAALWKAQCETTVLETQPTEDLEAVAAPKRRRRRRSGKLRRSALPAADAGTIVAALANGRISHARALLEESIGQAEPANRAKLDTRRSRTVAVMAEVIEAAERAGMRTAQARERFHQFLTAVQDATSTAELSAAAVDLLRLLRRKEARRTLVEQAFPELSRLVQEGLPGRIRLGEVAGKLGQHPTAVTHRLQRKFGMSFSEYVGRLRVNRAKELLRRTRLGVGEVAQRVGIRDPSNFAKLFRKWEGVSPSVYRAGQRSKR